MAGLMAVPMEMIFSIPPNIRLAYSGSVKKQFTTMAVRTPVRTESPRPAMAIFLVRCFWYRMEAGSTKAQPPMKFPRSPTYMVVVPLIRIFSRFFPSSMRMAGTGPRAKAPIMIGVSAKSSL